MASILTEHALTTVATMLAELGLLDTQTALLERLINAASERIERFCHRHFEYGAEIEEATAGMGTPFLVLSRTPLVEIASVTMDGTAFDEDSYEVADAEAGTVYRAAGWPWAGLRLSGIAQDPLPGTERQNIVATYAGGYVTPAQEVAPGEGNGEPDPGLPRTLPYDLEQCVIDTVVYLYRNRGQDLSIVSERVLSAAYQYDRAHSLPGSVVRGLAPYVRIISA